MDYIKSHPYLTSALAATSLGLLCLYCCYGSDDCSVFTCKRTPFHSIIKYELSQAEKETCARTWMENYVRSVLLKRVAPQADPDSAPAQTTEQLHRLIATEKGLLKAEDFEHVQKIIEVYSKALLCETRKAHSEARKVLYAEKRWREYAEKVLDQQKTEVKVFNKATMEILSIANIKANVFN